MLNPALAAIELTIDDLAEESVFDYINKLGKDESILQHFRNLIFVCSETSKIGQHHYFAESMSYWIESGIYTARKLENITIIFPYDKLINECDIVVELLDIYLLEFRASPPSRENVTASVNKTGCTAFQELSLLRGNQWAHQRREKSMMRFSTLVSSINQAPHILEQDTETLRLDGQPEMAKPRGTSRTAMISLSLTGRTMTF
jgi:hypothetical protein